MHMNCPAVRPLAPSSHPALELIALAQLSPENARLRLRALLLANPKYFGNVPPTSFNTVLKIQEDTTYECITSVAYDASMEQLRATIEIRQPGGYSSAAQINGSEEFVRFFISYDGGATWLDQGMRSVPVSDGIVTQPFTCDVILQMFPKVPRPRVRAILSWNSPPPPGAPDWSPVWGNVAESDMQDHDAPFRASLGKADKQQTKLSPSTLDAMNWPVLGRFKTDVQPRSLTEFFERSTGSSIRTPSTTVSA
jgi:hypothetical protein